MMSPAVRSKGEEQGWMSMSHDFRESLGCRYGMEGRFVALFRPYSLVFEAVLEIVMNKDVRGRRAQLSSDTDAKQKLTPHKLCKGRNSLSKSGVGSPFNSCFVLELVFTVWWL
jgi:hypothetical protein